MAWLGSLQGCNQVLARAGFLHGNSTNNNESSYKLTQVRGRIHFFEFIRLRPFSTTRHCLQFLALWGPIVSGHLACLLRIIKWKRNSRVSYQDTVLSYVDGSGIPSLCHNILVRSKSQSRRGLLKGMNTRRWVIRSHLKVCPPQWRWNKKIFKQMKTKRIHCQQTCTTRNSKWITSNEG